jgi:hypothetical protein
VSTLNRLPKAEPGTMCSAENIGKEKSSSRLNISMVPPFLILKWAVREQYMVAGLMKAIKIIKSTQINNLCYWGHTIMTSIQNYRNGANSLYHNTYAKKLFYLSYF